MKKPEKKLVDQETIEAQIVEEVNDMFSDLSEPGSVAHKEDQMVIDKFKAEETEDESEDEPEDESNESKDSEDADEATDDSTETEVDDELLDFSRRKLEKLAEESGVKFDKKVDDKGLREAIRNAKNYPDKQKNELLNWFNEQVSTFQNQQQAPVTTNQQQQQVQPAQAPVVTLDLSDDDFASALTDKKSFKKVLDSTAQIAQQQTIQQLIPVINNYVTQQIAMAQMVNDFYSDNADLKPFKNIVTFAAQAIHAKEPNKNFQEILKDTEKFLREKLNLKKEAKKVDTKKSDKPSFISNTKTNSRKNVAKDKEMNSTEKEIWDLVRIN